MSDRPNLEADTKRIEQLVGMVLKGRVRIPDFQRPLRWRHTDVRTLFDSIYRGFPIGTLLLWRRAADARQNLRIGPLHIDAPATDQGLWVVDGQQRLTSLVGALRHPEHSRLDGDIWNVWFDLETEAFFHPHRNRAIELAVPLARVLDATTFQDWLFDFVQATGRRDLLSVANRLGARIRDYRVPVYTVETKDPSVARDIFVRTNRTGRRMEQHEVFAALAPPGTGGRVRPEDIALRLSEHFGEVNANNVLKAAQALQGNDVTTGPSTTAEAPDRAVWMGETERALESAYEFVCAEVKHTRLLPARQTPIVALARFFHRFPDPSTRNRRLLRRWLWRGFFSGTLESDARTLRRAVVAVGTDEDAAVQALLGGVKTGRVPLAERVDSRDSWTRLAFLVLAHQDPLFPDADGTLDGDLFSWLKQHGAGVFAKVSSFPSVPWARFLAPGTKSSHLRAQLLTWCSDPDGHRDALASHLISTDAALALKAGDDDRFLSLRREDLNEASEALHDARAEPAAQDRPALRAS